MIFTPLIGVKRSICPQIEILYILLQMPTSINAGPLLILSLLSHNCRQHSIPDSVSVF